MVEQVECRVQLQHRLTSSRTHLLGQITVEPIPNSPVGVFPLLFRPPDGPAAVQYLETPTDIDRTYLLGLEIAAGSALGDHTSRTHPPNTHTHTHHSVIVVSGAPRYGGCVREV